MSGQAIARASARAPPLALRQAAAPDGTRRQNVRRLGCRAPWSACIAASELPVHARHRHGAHARRPHASERSAAAATPCKSDACRASQACGGRESLSACAGGVGCVATTLWLRSQARQAMAASALCFACRADHQAIAKQSAVRTRRDADSGMLHTTHKDVIASQALPRAHRQRIVAAARSC